MDLGILIAQKRKSAGITIDELALRSGVPKGTLNKIINGITKDPQLETVKSIARALNCTLDDFDDAPRSRCLSAEEDDFMHKYRKLDALGKKLVNLVVDTEVQRFEEDSKDNTIEFLKGSAEASDSEDNYIFFPLSEQDASAGTGTYLGPEAFHNIKVIDNEKTRRAAFAVRVKGDSMEPVYFDGDIVMISRERPGVGDIALVTLDGCGYIKRLGMGTLESDNKKYKSIPLDSDNVIVNGRAVGVLRPDWILEM